MSPAIPARPLPIGWIPTEWRAGEPPQFADLSGDLLTEPFLSHAAARRSGPCRTVTLDELQAPCAWGKTPAGFLLHCGRTGSSYLSRLVQQAVEHDVIKESRAINGALTRHWVPDTDALAGVDAMLRATSAGTGRFERPAVLKMSSWTTPLLVRHLETMPGTGSVFLWRDPVEVVASEIASPPEWALVAFEDDPGRRQFLGNEPASTTSPFPASSLASWYTEVWCAGVSAALRLSPERTSFVAYPQLVEDPAGCVRHVIEHLGLSARSDWESDIVGVRSRDAKDPGRPWEAIDHHVHLRSSTVDRIRQQTAELVRTLDSRRADP